MNSNKKLNALMFAFILLCINISVAQQQKKTLDQIVSENKGKVVVVDFWASWCKPCREELPEMKKLMDRFKDDNVAFVFISMDIEEQKWKNAAEKEGITNVAASFMISQIQKNEFSKSLNVKAIPRYLLFDKEGKLANTEAPRPSEGRKLRKEIEQYLQL